MATLGSRGILVIGAGKNAADHVTTFWNAISGPKTYMNGAANIETLIINWLENDRRGQ